MKREEARSLIKNLNLPNSSEKVLTKLLDCTYRKPKDGKIVDDPTLLVEIGSYSLQKAAKVGARQLFNIMHQLKDLNLLTDVKTGSHVKARLNVEALATHPVYEPPTTKEVKADRAQKAREKRAEQRELTRVINACKDAADKDRAEILTKMVLLQDVKDPEIKKAMMNWDVDRIRRAKANAEKLLVEANAQ